MTVTALDGVPPSEDVERVVARIDWSMVTSIVGALLALAAIAMAIFQSRIEPYLAAPDQRYVEYFLFATAVIVPMLFAWRRAIADHLLPDKIGAEPRYEHVSGWSALLLVTVFVVIAALVWWAADSDDANRTIHSEWGMWVVIGVSAMFVGVAAAPLLPRILRRTGLGNVGRGLGAWISAPIEWVGSVISAIDSFLVFAVANAAGTNRDNFFIRYAILLSMIGASAVLGYFWEAPYAFLPIIWGFAVAFAVSRRWAWIEQDRELAMLNPSLSQQHIRVGFGQNLRDEALIVFLSMFLLVPLALRQAELYAEASGVPLFTLTDAADVHSLPMWIAYYGTELAKAVPFVDWAEVYHVEGDAPVTAENALALHVVFGTRVLIDLVFLAALLQAIAAASRDAQQRDLFYRKRAIFHLDPFTEPDTLRSLVRRNTEGFWERNGDTFDEFPKYDLNKLVELAAHRDDRIRAAADFLLQRDGVEQNPHYRLSAEAAKKGVKPDHIQTIIHEIEQTRAIPNIYQLALTRRRLVGRTSMTMIRRQIIGLIAAAPIGRERTEALIAAIVGEHREATYQARGVALAAITPDTGRNLRVRSVVEQVAAHDAARALRDEAAKILAAHPLTPD